MILEMNFRRFRGLMREFSELNDRRDTQNRQNSSKNQSKACQVFNILICSVQFIEPALNHNIIVNRKQNNQTTK